jgi:LacI family transcriptional regulator
MKQRPTIATVAKRAGVAVSTVSRYFNGHYVSQSVRARLSEVIADLGYTRSWTARNLSLGRKGCIGVVVDSSQDPWFTQLLAGIEEELSLRETTLALASLELRGKYDAGLVFGWIAERRVDGLIIAKSRRRERSLLSVAAEARMPTVMVAPDEAVADVQIVRCDNCAAGVAVACHLAELGHKRIAFAGGPRHSVDSRHRLRGLREGLAQWGLTMDATSIFHCNSYEAEAGAEVAREFFTDPRGATAVVMGNDALALGFMRVAQQRGVRVPGDLSIVGFDNVPEGALLWPGLTTVAQPMREMGRCACRKLFEEIEGSCERDAVEYPMALVIRESTGAPPAGTR